MVGSWLDTYDFRARYLAAVLAGLPALGVLSLAFTDQRLPSSWPILTASGGTVAIMVLFSRFARVRGRAVEDRLYRAWNGKPSIAMLRHRDTRLNSHTKALYHERMESLGPSFRMPDRAQEEADPAGADALYEAAADELRRQAKITGYRAVARENIGYGFARNAYGLKSCALGLAAACFLTVTGYVWWHGAGRGLQAISPVDGLVLAALAVYAVAYAMIVTPTFVRHHAEAYATALLETAVILPEANDRRSPLGNP